MRQKANRLKCAIKIFDILRYIYMVQRRNLWWPCGAGIHACMHAYIHTYIHTCKLANIHTYTHTHIHTYTHTHIHTYTHTHIHTYIHTYTTPPPPRGPVVALRCWHTCIHAYMHTYIHTYIPPLPCNTLPLAQNLGFRTIPFGGGGGDTRHGTIYTYIWSRDQGSWSPPMVWSPTKQNYTIRYYTIRC